MKAFLDRGYDAVANALEITTSNAFEASDKPALVNGSITKRPPRRRSAQRSFTAANPRSNGRCGFTTSRCDDRKENDELREGEINFEQREQSDDAHARALRFVRSLGFQRRLRHMQESRRGSALLLSNVRRQILLTNFLTE